MANKNNAMQMLLVFGKTSGLRNVSTIVRCWDIHILVEFELVYGFQDQAERPQGKGRKGGCGF